MMTVNELAGEAGVTTDTVRHYVRIGLLQPQRHPSNGYKLFKQADVLRVRFIHQTKQLGYSLGEIKEIFSECRQGCLTCPKTQQILQQRLGDNRVKLKRMNHTQRNLEQAVALWEERFPNGIPDGDAVCRLIESRQHAE